MAMSLGYLHYFDLSKFFKIAFDFLISIFFIDPVNEYLEVRVIPSFVDKAFSDFKLLDLTNFYN